MAFLYKYTGLWLMLAFVFLPAQPVKALWAGSVDHAVFGELLAQHVNKGSVDYKAFKKNEARLDAYLDQLSVADPASMGKNEQFAYYINVYNAWTIKLILTGYPGVTSIKDLGGLLESPWEKAFVRLGDQSVTLDHIEHDILRPRFRDPRVHFAVNCASKSCPPLYPEPFTGDKLEAQLTAAATAFINDEKHNYVKNNTLYVSKIFKWFRKDFKKGVGQFVREYAEGKLKAQLTAAGDGIRIKYLNYDWSLNGE